MVRLGMSDRFLIRRSGPVFNIFDMKLKRNVGDGKGTDVSFVKREDAEKVRLEMVTRVALISCDENTRRAAFSEKLTASKPGKLVANGRMLQETR